MYDAGTDFCLLQGLIQAVGAWYSLAQLIAWIISLLAVAQADPAQADPAQAGPAQVLNDAIPLLR